METSESKVFLNLVVQKIDPSNIQEFMRSWLKQVCKDFKIVFIVKDLSGDQLQAVDYALNFAKALDLAEMVVVVSDENAVPKARSMKILKDTSELPCDKLEILKMRSSFKQLDNEKVSEKLEKSISGKTSVDGQHLQKKPFLDSKPKHKVNAALDAKSNSQKIDKDSNKLAETKLSTRILKSKQPDKVEVASPREEKLNLKPIAKPEKENPSNRENLGNEQVKKPELQKKVEVKPHLEKVFFKIIIPNYNNMAYIKKCLDSILEQTFQDFKIIVVDDLSTDGSDKFCEMYARKYPSKIVFQQLKKKGYAGTCRNLALDYPIDCEYVWAIDGDDYIRPKTALSTLYEQAKSLKYDAIFFNGWYDKNGKLFNLPARKKIDLTDPIYSDPTYHTCKIAKPKCFGRYLENCMVGQDLYHSYITLSKIKTYINISNKFYVYRFNMHSTSHRTGGIQQKQIREKHRKFFARELKKLALKINNKNILINLKSRIEMVEKRVVLEEKREVSRRKIVIAMASFPARKSGMLDAVKRLLPQCDKFYLWLNDYQEIPEELKKMSSEKLVIKLAKENSDLKENGRYTWINQNKDCYYLTVDDDIIYPSTYVNLLVSKIDQYCGKSIMSFHGTRFINGREIYFPFSKDVPADVQVHRVGGGVMGFIPSEIGFTCPSIEELKAWDGDASISVWATLHSIKKFVIAHTQTFLLEQKNETGKKLSLVNALCLKAGTKKKRQRAYAQIKQWETLS